MRAWGEPLLQQRVLLVRNQTGGAYTPIGAADPAPILLDPAFNNEYSQTLEPGWPPLFIVDCVEHLVRHPTRDVPGRTGGYRDYVLLNPAPPIKAAPTKAAPLRGDRFAVSHQHLLDRPSQNALKRGTCRTAV